MIDTIVLTLKQSMFTILDHDKFSPSTRGLYNATAGYYRLGSRSNITCKQNPTPRELEKVYKPRLTVTKRINREKKFEITLKIEFSVPKLLYGNNFDEVENSDFNLIIQTLKQKLEEMGVVPRESCLINAPVSALHYSKNIVLTDYTSPYSYLSEIRKVNINKILDITQIEYRNGGHLLKFHANSFEIAFYDKVRDLEKAKISEKRAEEKDNALQLGLFDVLKKRKPFEVLRIEIRLNKRQKIKQILKKIGKEAEPTFANIFNQDIAKKVLLHYLGEIEDAYPPLLVYQYDSPKNFFQRLLAANPELKPNRALELTAFRAILDEISVREYRQIIEKYGDYYWYSLNKKMKKLKQANGISVFSMLKKQLIEFKPIKLVDFQDKMLNNDKYGR